MEPGGEQVVVSIRAALARPPDVVWNALRQPALWWAREADVDMRPGGRYRVKLDGGWMEGRIASLEPLRVLAIDVSFATRNVSFETHLTFVLSAEGAGTAVTVEHSGPPVMAWMGETRELERGWRETLVKLSNYLRGAV